MPFRGNIFMVVLSMYSSWAVADTAPATTCGRDVIVPKRPVQAQVATNAAGTMLMNGVPTRVYPLRLALEHFHIVEADLEQIRGKSVLVLGEGFGELLPALLNVGAHAVAVDLLYGVKTEALPESWMNERILGFREQYGSHLVAGSALNLPFASGRFDFVLSHMLLNNFVNDQNAESALRISEEALRVLKPGGESWHTGFITEGTIQKVRIYLNRHFGVTQFNTFSERIMYAPAAMGMTYAPDLQSVAPLDFPFGFIKYVKTSSR